MLPNDHGRSKPVKLRTSICFTGLPPKSDIRSARQRVQTTSRLVSRSTFAVTARSRARPSMRIISSEAGLRNSHAADGARRTRVRAGGPPDFLAVPVVYTFRKSLLVPKPRDVTYRQCKCLSVLVCDAFGADLNCSESSRGERPSGPMVHQSAAIQKHR